MKTNLFNVMAFMAALLFSTSALAQERDPNRLSIYKGDNILKTYSVDEIDYIGFDYVANDPAGIAVVDQTNFTAKVQFTKPDNCEYYLVAVIPADSEEDLTAYVKNHYAAKLTESKEYEFTGLKAGLEYYALALPVDKYGLSTVLSKQKFQTVASQYEQKASTFFDVDYWGDAYLNGYQNFVIRMGDCQHNGVYPKGNGRIYNFSIYSKKSDGSAQPMPPVGTYSYYTGDKPIDMCMENSESLMFEYSNFKDDKSYKSTTVKYNDATLTVTKNSDGTYTVKALVAQENGEFVELTYTGAVAYRDKSFKGYDGPNLDHDVEFNCDYITPYDLGGTCFEMMDGGDPSAPDASWYKRNRITIFLAADANGMPRLGTFGVTKEGENGTVRAGFYKNFGGGVSGSDGTRYEYVEQLGVQSIFGFVTGGSVTISTENVMGKSYYNINTDFVTDKGVSIKAHYLGPFKSNKSSSKRQALRLAPKAN